MRQLDVSRMAMHAYHSTYFARACATRSSTASFCLHRRTASDRSSWLIRSRRICSAQGSLVACGGLTHRRRGIARCACRPQGLRTSSIEWPRLGRPTWTQYLGLCMAARAMGRGKGGRAGDAESRVEEQGLGWAGFLKLDGAREAGLGDTRRSAILIKMGLGWAWGHSVDLGDLESHDRAACRNQS